MKTLYKNRLLKLAKFLRKIHKEKRETWDFYIVVRGEKATKHKLGCGSAGCAIGHLPEVFPRHFEYRNYGVTRIGLDVMTKTDPDEINFSAGARFLGFDYSQQDYWKLFSPGCYDSLKVTPLMVAKEIEKYVKEKTNE